MSASLLLQSSVAAEYDLFFWSMVALCGFVGVGIAAVLIFSAWRYRRREPNELPRQVTNYIPAEVAWIGIPTILFFLMFLAGVQLYLRIERPPADAEVVYVVAKQWMWKTQHLNGIREINTLHVPVGKPIRLDMISQDVIHSFYVPAFRIKQDVLPKRYTSIWFNATKPGVYHLLCAEYCGANHSQMGGWVFAMTSHDYQQWMERSGAEGSLASTGEKLFHQFACSNCHHYSGHGRAPNLIGLYGTPVTVAGGATILADDTYLRTSILQPRAQLAEGYQSLMPTYEGQLTEDDVIALIAYIKALGAQPLRGLPANSSQNPAWGSENTPSTPSDNQPDTNPERSNP